MQAIILAAGEGSRLRPFTADKPKPMVRAGNKPILQHVVEALVENDVRDMTIVVGYHREKVQSHFGDGAKFGARIRYAFQDTLTGTARALATAPRPSGEFLVLSGDNVIEAPLIRALLDAPPQQPALVVHRSERPQRYGVTVLDGDHLRQISEKPDHPRSDWVSTGVYRLTPTFHDRARTVADGANAGLPDVLQLALSDGQDVRAVRSNALWSDAVYPWDLLRVHSDLLLRSKSTSPIVAGTTIEPPVLMGDDVLVAGNSTLGAGTCIGSNVVIGPNCVIENCVIYDDVQISAGSILRNTIVGAGTRIGPRFTAISGAADLHFPDGWHHQEDFGAILGEDCRIGGAVTCMPGTLLGNASAVRHGRTIQGFMEDRSNVA